MTGIVREVPPRWVAILDACAGGDALRLVGMLGEFAVASWLGVPMRVIVPGSLGDGGWDCEYNGWRVQVKSSPVPAPNLIVPAAELDDLRCDVFVLTRVLLPVPGEPAVVSVEGWVQADALAANRVRSPRTGDSECYEPPPDLLRTSRQGLEAFLASPGPSTRLPGSFGSRATVLP